MTGELVVFVGIVMAVAVVGLGLGILVARWLDGRVAADADDNEEPGGDDRSDP
jgi:hypothetical protein